MISFPVESASEVEVAMSEGAKQFLDIDLPPVFSIDVPAESMPSPDGWIPYWDYCEREGFDRLDDGSYICAGYGGSPIYLRVVKILKGGEIDVVDGGGDRYRYRIRPVSRAS